MMKALQRVEGAVTVNYQSNQGAAPKGFQLSFAKAAGFKKAKYSE
jgi:hypothetical protein